jgi:hypothetical protein
VKTTVAARPSVKVRVVWRRRFGPLVAIHVRDDWKPCTPERSEGLPLESLELPEEDEPVEPPRIDPVPPVGAGDGSEGSVVRVPAGGLVVAAG